MDLSRLMQALALIWVTFVMIRSYFVSDMTFQFGGLALGAVVFLIGRGLQRPSDA